MPDVGLLRPVSADCFECAFVNVHDHIVQIITEQREKKVVVIDYKGAITIQRRCHSKNMKKNDKITQNFSKK